MRGLNSCFDEEISEIISGMKPTGICQYHTYPPYGDTKKIIFVIFKNFNNLILLSHNVPEPACRVTNSADLDETAQRSSLITVYTVFSSTHFCPNI